MKKIKNTIKFGSTLLLVLSFVYVSVFFYLYNDNKRRVDEILNQNRESVKIYYKLTYQYFQNVAQGAINMISHNQKLIENLKKFNTNISETEKNKIRKEIYNDFLEIYSSLKSVGVLQFQFVNGYGYSILRMHKPDKYGDKISNFRYSIKKALRCEKAVYGFEKGKSFPGYRNVMPLYDKEKKFVGVIDISFSPELIQKNLAQIGKIHSHFLINEKVFKEIKWNLDNKRYKYVKSLENDSYLRFVDISNDEHHFHHLNKYIKSIKSKIKEDMSKHKEFSLYIDIDNKIVIVSFIPIKNLKNEVVAYIVSYVNSPIIKNLIFDYIILNVVLILIIMLLYYIFYKGFVHQNELKKEKEKYKLLAEYDPLTKLPNRNLLYMRLHQAKSRANRNNKKFAVMFIDLDNFKNINDSHGHKEGDRVLVAITKIIKNIVRKEDTIARFGGDEFVLIIEDLENIKDVSIIAKKIIEKVKEPLDFGYRKYYVGTSIGISLYPDDTDDIHELIKYSDTAMYKAKKSGKNTFEYFSSMMGNEVINKLNIENDIRIGIKKDEFVAYYQPQINAKTGELVGLESLVRWLHPKKGFISPAEFIPVAEESNLIVELDRYLMKKTLSQIVKWAEQGYKFGRISLNLSIRELKQSDFIDNLQKTLQKTKCKPEWLELEVTETLLMDNPQNAIKKLNKISSLGVKIAIDDFGTGFSSLSYLKKLPLNKLKVDKSFVDDMLEDKDSEVIVRVIIDLAKNLGLDVLAEGVETKEQVEFLMKCGCNVIQGYYFSRPKSAEEIKQSYFNH